MRLAGTASQYSKKAMPQLASTATVSYAGRYFRCPYQANVMNTLDASSIRTGRTWGEVSAGMAILCHGITTGIGTGTIL